MPATLTANPPPFVCDGDWGLGSYPIKAGEVFKPGDIVHLDSNGQLVLSAAAGASVGNVKILGVSAGDAAQLLTQFGSGAECPVHIPTPTSTVLLPVGHSTAALAVIAATDMDTPLTLPIARDANGIYYADKENNGTNDRLLCYERAPEYPFSETFGWFRWKFVHGTTFAEGT